MEKLVTAFNPSAVLNVMCRNTIFVSCDGYLYDCDFNQMLDLKVSCSTSQHVSEFNFDELKNRNIFYTVMDVQQGQVQAVEVLLQIKLWIGF